VIKQVCQTSYKGGFESAAELVELATPACGWAGEVRRKARGLKNLGQRTDISDELPMVKKIKDIKIHEEAKLHEEKGADSVPKVNVSVLVMDEGEDIPA